MPSRWIVLCEVAFLMLVLTKHSLWYVPDTMLSGSYRTLYINTRYDKWFINLMGSDLIAKNIQSRYKCVLASTWLHMSGVRRLSVSSFFVSNDQLGDCWWTKMGSVIAFSRSLYTCPFVLLVFVVQDRPAPLLGKTRDTVTLHDNARS